MRQTLLDQEGCVIPRPGTLSLSLSLSLAAGASSCNLDFSFFVEYCNAGSVAAKSYTTMVLT